ncbi:hypothetical protein NDU88_004073 [Pleurodeles waltl]|uniref:Uncharacterized protein n=1 Tax=Pleurodeles waltl TaxID=8319 RepID=A0AAV7UFH8_PLEWA|nr:hypothetical protein NDU88_004073 [Pleurodeles waltl]
MQQSLHSIDSKIDSLNLRTGHMAAKLDKQTARLSVTEQQQISDEEDTLHSVTSKYKDMEKVLAVICAKNEDLEVQFYRSNLRITRIPESTNTGPMDRFVENLLRENFEEDNLSSALVVEHAQRFLKASPPRGA